MASENPSRKICGRTDVVETICISGNIDAPLYLKNNRKNDNESIKIIGSV